LARRAAAVRAQRLAEAQATQAAGDAEAQTRLQNLGYDVSPEALQRLSRLSGWARRRVPALAPCPNADQVADVPTPFVFRIVGADGVVARCVDARLLYQLERIGGLDVLRDALAYTVIETLPPGARLDRPDVLEAVTEAVDVNAARFKSRWRQVDPERGIETPSVGSLSAIMRPRLWAPPGSSAAANATAWATDPAGQRMRYASGAVEGSPRALASGEDPVAAAQTARAIGIGALPIVLPPALFGEWFASVTEAPAVPAVGLDSRGLGRSLTAPNASAREPGLSGPLVRVTYEQPRGSGRMVRALVTRTNKGAPPTERRLYTDVFGTTMALAPDEVVQETDARPFVGLSIHSVDPALLGTAYGYAVPGGAGIPPVEAQVPFDVLWRLWGDIKTPPPSRSEALPPPLALAANNVERAGERGDVIVSPAIFPLAAGIILAPAAHDTQEALEAYASASADNGPSPLERFLNGVRMLVEGQVLLVPSSLWAPADAPTPVAFVVRRLFGYVRRTPYAPGAYEVARVPAATITDSIYVVDIERPDTPTPATSYEALAAYYAVGPQGRRRSESPAGDAAEATAIEASLAARTDGGLAVSLTGALPPTLEVIMASREAPTSRERAHWSQFMRRMRRATGGALPEPPAVARRALPGLHVGPLPTSAPMPGVGSLSATALAIDPSRIGRRVFRYDTARAAWHDVSLDRTALPSLTDRELEDLLLALPETPGGARAPILAFYLVGPEGNIVSAADLTRTVTFAPQVASAAERQEDRRRTEAQRAQAQSRAAGRAAMARATEPLGQSLAPTQTTRSAATFVRQSGSLLGRRKQPPSPSPTFAGRAALPPGLAALASASLDRLLASSTPEAVADLVGVSPERVREILQSDAWWAIVRGDDSDAGILAARSADPGAGGSVTASVLDVLDNAVYEFTGVGPEVIAEVADLAQRDPRWRPDIDGVVTPRRVLGIVAAAYDPVVRTRSQPPDSNASAVILNRIYFALGRRNNSQ
jgi:hypothetical protein